MKKSRAIMFGLLAACGIGQAVWDRTQVQPTYKEKFMPKQTGYVSGLSSEQFLLALSGFREMIAGILWVKGDSYFESGNYDAILPIIRLVTWLDPGQIDVYATGMWHIAYNFTDEQSRSDRRYIPSAVALGDEGSRNNPNTYEMFFETGWLFYHKIDDDYGQSVSYWEKAITKPDIIPARRNLLSNAYQRDGQIDKALEYYEKLLAEAKKRDAAGADFQARVTQDTIEGNLDTMLVRMSQRGWFGREEGPGAIPYDTQPPFDVNFSVRITIPEPKVVRFEGSYGVRPVGTRIRVVLRDEDYPNAVPGGMKWKQDGAVNLDPPRDLTFMQDQLYVKNQRFDRTCDMSRDPTMYPFKTQNYVAEFYYNPRSAPPHIQDKFSWNGEGFTDKNFLNTEIRPNQRVLYHNIPLTRDMILRRGEWSMGGGKVPVLATKNFVDKAAKGSEDFIEIPSLRSQDAQATK
ncbi:MAG: tetratricopeptide repeat protein [Chthonomonas sp.]|nr:tetratricopeptide repeat protein [Chthonomonas sp.]